MHICQIVSHAEHGVHEAHGVGCAASRAGALCSWLRRFVASVFVM